MPIGIASSPKGRAFGNPHKLHLFAKASPFGRGVTAGDGEGEGADLVQYTAFLSSGGDFTQISAVGLCHVYK